MSLIPALYLIPVGLSDAPADTYLPPHNVEVVKEIRTFIVENVRTARRFLKKFCRDLDIGAITFFELNNHTDPIEIPSFIEPLRRGEPVGVMSEAGCPAVADPGARVVAIAQSEGLRVIPLVGPSSILMSLMASGFNGQGFAFNGYLPVSDAEKGKAIKNLDAICRRTGMTQIFIETPYRNNRTVKLLAETLHPDTLLCVAAGITDPGKECIRTFPARMWRKFNYDYGKIPAIFLINRP